MRLSSRPVRFVNAVPRQNSDRGAGMPAAPANAISATAQNGSACIIGCHQRTVTASSPLTTLASSSVASMVARGELAGSGQPQDRHAVTRGVGERPGRDR